MAIFRSKSENALPSPSSGLCISLPGSVYSPKWLLPLEPAQPRSQVSEKSPGNGVGASTVLARKSVLRKSR